MMQKSAEHPHTCTYYEPLSVPYNSIFCAHSVLSLLIHIHYDPLNPITPISCAHSVPSVLIYTYMYMYILIMNPCLNPITSFLVPTLSPQSPMSGDPHWAAAALPGLVLFLLPAGGGSAESSWSGGGLRETGHLFHLPLLLHPKCRGTDGAQDQGALLHLQVVWGGVWGTESSVCVCVFVCVDYRVECCIAIWVMYTV